MPDKISSDPFWPFWLVWKSNGSRCNMCTATTAILHYPLLLYIQVNLWILSLALSAFVARCSSHIFCMYFSVKLVFHDYELRISFTAYSRVNHLGFWVLLPSLTPFLLNETGCHGESFTVNLMEMGSVIPIFKRYFFDKLTISSSIFHIPLSTTIACTCHLYVQMAQKVPQRYSERATEVKVDYSDLQKCSPLWTFPYVLVLPTGKLTSIVFLPFEKAVLSRCKIHFIVTNNK